MRRTAAVAPQLGLPVVESSGIFILPVTIIIIGPGTSESRVRGSEIARSMRKSGATSRA